MLFAIFCGRRLVRLSSLSVASAALGRLSSILSHFLTSVFIRAAVPIFFTLPSRLPVLIAFAFLSDLYSFRFFPRSVQFFRFRLIFCRRLFPFIPLRLFKNLDLLNRRFSFTSAVRKIIFSEKILSQRVLAKPNIFTFS